MVKVRVRYSRAIEEITITGDFFLHPEEAILDIEKALLGAGVEEEAQTLEEKIKSALKTRGAELIGIQAEDIALAVKEALP
jgi:lipoate-protein ligase A